MTPALPAVDHWRTYNNARPQAWRVVVWVANIDLGMIFGSLTGYAVVDDFGTLVVVGGFS